MRVPRYHTERKAMSLRVPLDVAVLLERRAAELRLPMNVVVVELLREHLPADAPSEEALSRST